MISQAVPVRVLHITNAYPYEATPEYGVFVKEQIESLPADCVDSRIIFINGRAGGKRAYLDGLFRVRAALGECDVIHCHHAYSFLIAMLAGAIGKRPIVLSFLNDWTYEVKDLPFAWLRKTVCHLSVSLSSKVIFKSPIPEEIYPSQKAINLPNGVDEGFFDIRDRIEAREALGLDLTTCYLLFVSSKNQYREQKRYDIFRETLEHVRRMVPSAQVSEYVMVGQPRKLVPLVFSACDVHVLTSDYEGSPNSVKEALCCGTPVVTRDVGNVREMLDGVTGTEVVSSNKPELIARAIVKILEGKPRAEDVRSSFLAKGITKRRIADRLVALYRELARKEARRA